MVMATRDGPRRRRQVPAYLVAVAAAGFILLLLQPSLFSDSYLDEEFLSVRRQLESEGGSEVTDPNAVTLSSDATPSSSSSRDYCQIVYILGVEGATHHGFTPIVEALAKTQVDPKSNLQYHVNVLPKALKCGLLGWYRGYARRWGWGSYQIPEIDDPKFVQSVVKASCPNNGQKHVLIEWASFPSGQEDDHRSYRVHRQHDWLSMTPEEIANDEKALQQPFNVTAFVEAYSPYADVKFVVLHRPFLSTIASHHSWDGGAEIHSNVIRGFMLILGRFLDKYRTDLVTGAPLWFMACVERIMSKNYNSPEDVVAARKDFISNLAEFLGWPNKECPHCFDVWFESKKNPKTVLGESKVEMLLEHTKILEGVWPPIVEGTSEEEQCAI